MKLDFLRQQIRQMSCFSEHSLGWIEETGSTNDDLKQNLENGRFAEILVAGHQRAGRGQFDRRWVSEPGQALLFSFSHQFTDRNCDFPLSLQVAAAAAEALIGLAPAAKIWLKWPNDIYYGEGKLGGILVENIHFGEKCHFVAGVGINLRPFLPGTAAVSDFSSTVTAELLLTAILREFAAIFCADAELARKAWEKHAAGFWERKFLLETPQTKKASEVRPHSLNADGSLNVLCEKRLLNIVSGHLTGIFKR